MWSRNCIVLVGLLWLGAAASPARADEPESMPELEYQSVDPETHRVRVAVEMGSAMAVGTLWYVMYLDFNLPDWDYPSVSARLNGSAIRFDSNSLYTNAFAHPLVGSAYYGLARVNGLGPFESLAVAFTTSAFWEFVPEYREYVSFNDLIFTPFGGMAIGEVLFHLSDYFHSAPGRGRWVHRLLEHTLGLPRSIHYALDGGPRPGAGFAPDSLELSSAYWHRFDIRLQMTGATDAASASSDRWYGFELETELVAVPGHLQPGRFAGVFSEGEFTDFSLRLSSTGDSAGDARVHAGALLAGWLAQNLHEDDGQLDGWAIAAGYATALDYRDWTIGGERDLVGAAHLGGLGLDIHVALGHFGWARLRGQAYADFAAVHSLALDRWREQYGDPGGLKTVMEIRDYYYGYGASTWLSLDVELAGFEVGASLRWGQWHSIQGMDRAPERVTHDAPSRDEMTEYELSASYGPRGHPFRIGIGVGGLTRWGRLDGVVVRRRQSFATIEVGMRF